MRVVSTLNIRSPVKHTAASRQATYSGATTIGVEESAWAVGMGGVSTAVTPEKPSYGWRFSAACTAMRV